MTLNFPHFFEKFEKLPCILAFFRGGVTRDFVWCQPLATPEPDLTGIADIDLIKKTGISRGASACDRKPPHFGKMQHA